MNTLKVGLLFFLMACDLCTFNKELTSIYSYILQNMGCDTENLSSGFPTKQVSNKSPQLQ